MPPHLSIDIRALNLLPCFEVTGPWSCWQGLPVAPLRAPKTPWEGDSVQLPPDTGTWQLNSDQVRREAGEMGIPDSTVLLPLGDDRGVILTARQSHAGPVPKSRSRSSIRKRIHLCRSAWRQLLESTQTQTGLLTGNPSRPSLPGKPLSPLAPGCPGKPFRSQKRHSTLLTRHIPQAPNLLFSGFKSTDISAQVDSV